MAVFAGGCTIDAVEVVCHDEALPSEAVFETVAALVDRSLLTTEERAGSMRYGMLESIRQYALGAGRGRRGGGTRERHLAWMLDFAAQADLDGPIRGPGWISSKPGWTTCGPASNGVSRHRRDAAAASRC